MINRRFKANRPKIVGSTDMIPYWQVIEQIISESDIILEVLDARMPELSRNDELEKLVKRKNKELIFILNKSDLVSENMLRKMFNKLKKEAGVFSVSTKERMGTRRLREYLIRISKNQNIRIGVLGYPNTGKSSIINSLVLRKKAPVSSKAGTTHGIQWVKSSNLEVMDSPGVIPIGKNDEMRLSLIGSKNPEKIKNLELVAYKIIDLLPNKNRILEYYEIKEKAEDNEEIIRLIGVKKGFIKKHGEIEENRVAIQIIRDWQRGNLRL